MRGFLQQHRRHTEQDDIDGLRSKILAGAAKRGRARAHIARIINHFTTSASEHRVYTEIFQYNSGMFSCLSAHIAREAVIHFIGFAFHSKLHLQEFHSFDVVG